MSDNHAKGPDVLVQVDHAVKTLSPSNQPFLSIRYKFAFPKLAMVHIRGLGDVPATGNYAYITGEKSILFTDPATGNPITEVPLSETIIAASQPPLTDIPSEFPRQSRSFPWDVAHPFLPAADAVLNQYFRYEPREDGGHHFIATTYAPLDLHDVADGVTAFIALQFSFPYDVAAGTFRLRIQSSVREGRRLSSVTKPTESQPILHAGDRFVDQLVGEMQLRSK